MEVNPISFNGSITRRSCNSRQGGEPEITRKEMIKSYERPIEKLESYRQFAIRLDNLMYKDPDIKQKVGELSDDIKIDVFEGFDGQVNRDSDAGIDVVSPALYVSKDTLTKKGVDFDDCMDTCMLEVPYNKEGPDKKQIVNWLDDLKVFDK